MSILNIYIRDIYTVERPTICIYDLYICIYSEIHPCALTKLHIYIYIYICSIKLNSLHTSYQCCRKLQSARIKNIQSLLEALAGYYQEVSQKHKHSLNRSSTTTACTNPTQIELQDISPRISI